MRTFGALAWHMGVSEYMGRKGRPLEGASVEACWEPALAGAMQTGGYALEEEVVMAALCEDLAAKREPPASTSYA